MKNEIHICSICKNPYIGYGNYATPVNDGYCCDVCNREVVLQERIKKFNERKLKSGRMKEVLHG